MIRLIIVIIGELALAYMAADAVTELMKKAMTEHHMVSPEQVQAMKELK
jgi:hypothetical protein